MITLENKNMIMYDQNTEMVILIEKGNNLGEKHQLKDMNKIEDSANKDKKLKDKVDGEDKMLMVQADEH